MIFTATVFFILILGLLSQRFRPSYLFFFAALSFYLSNDLQEKDFALLFGSPILISLVLLIALSSVLERCVPVQSFNRFLFSNTAVRFVLLKLMVVTSLFSAVVNNTAVVSLYMNAIQRFAPAKMRRQLLLPLSFFALLGGTLTLVGTSTNLMVNALVVARGQSPLSFFSFGLVGWVLCLVCGLFLVLVAPWAISQGKEETTLSSEKYFLEAQVEAGSPLIGRSISENKMRNLQELFLVEVIRADQILSPVNPSEVLQAGDILVFAGAIEHVEVLSRFEGVSLKGNVHRGKSRHLVEVIVAANSDLVGESIKEAEFRTRFDAAVVAVKRQGETLSGKIGLIRLRAGDRLVLTTGSDFVKLAETRQAFYHVGAVSLHRHLNQTQSWIFMLAFLLVLGLSAFGLISLLKGLVVLTIGGFLFDLFDQRDFRSAHSFDTFLLVGSAAVLGRVLEQSQMMNFVVDELQSVMAASGPYGVLAILFFFTAVLTQFMSNLAAAAFVVPIALAVSQALLLNPIVFVMSVAFGATASLLSPYSYQTHMMVYGAGGYSLKEFIKLGFPLFVIYSLFCLYLIPSVFGW